MRQLKDAQELRAVTHPVRIALLEVLHLNGVLTATEAGELIGETPTTCSFHLRQLAKYGFVEEAGGGTGRRRPWRAVARGLSFSSESSDAEVSIAATALESLLVKRWTARHEQWEQTRHFFPPEWRDAADVRQYVIYVTPTELKEAFEAVGKALIGTYHDRIANPALRPEGAVPVEIMAMSHPLSQAPSKNPDL
ncbi:MAG: winged helix-turn-helix domain-containing protein [Acidimicrobiales bacterium]